MLYNLLNKIITTDQSKIFPWFLMITPINSLLRNQPWASERLKPFQGKVIFIRVIPVLLKLTIDHQGEFTLIDKNIQPNHEVDHRIETEIIIPPTLLPRLWLGDDQAIYEIKIKGNTALGSELAYVYKNLKLDFTEDLSKLFGDAIAEKIVKITHRIARLQEHSLKNFAHVMTNYIKLEEIIQTEIQPVHKWLKEVDIARNDTARLEKRLEQLAKSIK